MISHTTDGQNWEFQVLPDTNLVLEDVFFLDENIGWAVGIVNNQYPIPSKGLILYTQNGGDTWTKTAEEVLPDDTWINAVYAIDEHTVYAVGQNNTILKYTQLNKVSEASISKFSITPNPANEYIKISSEFSPLSEFEISHINGNIILTGDIQDSKTIDISKLQSGAYFIKIISGDELFSEKFIIEK